MFIKVVLPAVGSLLIMGCLLQVTLPPSAHSQEAKTQSAKKAEPAKVPAKTPPKVEGTGKSAEPKTTEKPKATTDLDLLEATAKLYEKAFNAGNAQELAALFADKAEVVDEDGDVLQGRPDIEARYVELFKTYPEAKIVVEVTLLRQLGPDVAVEDGFSTIALDPKEPESRSPYTVVHVKRDGKWLFASVRDYPEETTLTAHDHLVPLEWMVGHWLDESRSGKVETTCAWSDDGNYLLQEYVVKTRRGVELKGTQRIGWDPLRRMIRAWVFDDAGGIAESTWTAVEGGWVVKAEGTMPDGQPISATRFVIPVTADSYRIDSSNQIFGGELLPDSSVRVVRQPPAPTE